MFLLKWSNNIYIVSSKFKHIVDIVAYIVWMDMLKLFMFWMEYDANRWPTDLVSIGQVEPIVYFVTCLTYD